MRITEGKPLLYQIIRNIGRIGKAALGALQHPILLYGHGGKHFTKHRQTHFYRVHGVKDLLLILLHILIIRKRKSFHHGQKPHQIAVNPTRLTACQFGNIRVLLLRHDAGSGAVRIVQLNESKFMRAPKNQLLRESAQVHHHHRQIKGQLTDEIAIRHAV